MHWLGCIAINARSEYSTLLRQRSSRRRLQDDVCQDIAMCCVKKKMSVQCHAEVYMLHMRRFPTCGHIPFQVAPLLANCSSCIHLKIAPGTCGWALVAITSSRSPTWPASRSSLRSYH